MRSTPPLRLHLRQSRYPLLGLVGLHVLALPMIFLSGLPWVAKWLLGLLVLVSAVWYWHGLRKDSGPSLLRLLPDGSWGLVWNDVEVEARLGVGVYRTTWLLRLPLHLADGRHLRLMLWPDSASADELRQLRIWLRWGKVPPPA